MPPLSEIATGAAAGATAAAMIAATATVIIAIILLVNTTSHEGFYTEFAREEPTRSYVPYAGTVPFGDWGSGTQPWAEVVPAPRRAARLQPWADPAPMTCGGPIL